MSSNNPNNPDEYNGYPNYQTWCVSLWIDNDQSTARVWADLAAELHRNPPDAPDGEYAPAPERRAVLALADMLKEEHEEQAAGFMPGASVFSDLLNSALGRVDWHYIAQNIIEDAADNQ